MKFTDSLTTKTFIFGTLGIIAAMFAVTPEEYPTWQEILTAGAAVLALASGRQAIGKAAEGKARALIPWFAAGMLALAPFAGSAAPVVPYAAVTVDRLSGPDEWSTGFEVGAEATKGIIYVLGSYSVHDWLSERETDAYPWDATARIEAGFYDSGHSLLGVGVTPYGGLALQRPSGPQAWSLGATVGVEADFDGIWLRVANDWQDVVTKDTAEVYPWDSTFRLAVGVYFGGDDEEKGAKPRTRSAGMLMSRK
jgi:hypothetical protein